MVLIGARETGKSALYRRFLKNEFFPDTIPTDGFNRYAKQLVVKKRVIELELIDTAAWERHIFLPDYIYKQTHGILFVFDVTSRSSYRSVLDQSDTIRSRVPPNAVAFLVGNKIDSGIERQVPQSEAKKFAKKNNLQYFDVSAKTGHKVDATITECANLAISKIENGQLQTFYDPEFELPPRFTRPKSLLKF